MKLPYRLKLPVLILILSLGCKSSRQEASLNNQLEENQSIKDSVTEDIADAANKEIGSMPPVSPEATLILGTVLKVYEIEEKASGVCNSYPCKARISVDEVLGRGHSFLGFLKSGDTLDAQFTLTLTSTSTVFPDRNYEPLPGLVEGDVFEAEISTEIGLNQNSRDKKYIIGIYKKK